jgi:hypothetical protein
MIQAGKNEESLDYAAAEASDFSAGHSYPGMHSSPKEGRGLASAKGEESSSQEAGASEISSKNSETALVPSGAEGTEATNGKSSTGASSTASESAWVSYMAGTSKSELIERLRQSSSLREALHQRMEELRAKGDGSGMVELLKEALAAAEQKDQLPLKDLKPASAKEIFSMDSEGTDAQVRDLLSELEGAASHVSLETTLFERNSFALRRSLVRGVVKGPQ